MFKWEEFEQDIEKFYDYIISEFKANGGYSPIIYGMDLKNIYYENEIQEDKWYYCEDSFHFGDYQLLSDVEYSMSIFDAVWITYGERHDANSFFDHYNCDELEPKYMEKFAEKIPTKHLEEYKDDMTYILEEYAFRQLFPKIFNYLQKV